MGAHMSNLHFRLMSFNYRFRDWFSPPERVLAETGIAEGSRVLDFGCGSGSFIRGAAKLVGGSGKVYALDVHPLAIKAAKALAWKRHLTNVQTIQSDCRTGLPDRSVDTVLLFDTFHHLSNAGDVLAELHRVLADGGVLSFSDHHMSEEEILRGVTGTGLFRLAERGRRTYAFAKIAD